ncbi:hypothetical protein SAMN04488028_105213 [Reichenbachiella agariperforans]|uniref:Virulence protein RhuM family protein n=1 Tax=Reichenbachiella agariperforans TaxID=156994 RepID=A0A1M6SZC8_REIAG|nr:hypothetical protein [Reichenbachiella agariperforans]SHK49918.1 hypothetical protein SAMN04488028_105213 [Reichenbachiella agariperforans]
MEKLSPNQSSFILYTSQSGDVKVDVLLQDESVWLTQKAMQELFGKAKATISEHISNIFKEGELEENSVVRKFRTTADDGKEYTSQLVLVCNEDAFFKHLQCAFLHSA